MKIIYFLTDLTKTGGSMTLYNFMNGLTEKGHDVYVITTREYFKWEYDGYKDFINKPYKQLVLSDFIRKCISKINLGRSLSNSIAVLTKRLLIHYNKLNIDGDILIATHISTADVVFKLGLNKKIVLHSQHFEELMYHDLIDIATVKIYNNLPFNHVVNCSWLKQMFIYNYNIYPTIITPGMNHKIFCGEVSREKYFKTKKINIITYCDPNREFKGFEQQIEILEKIYSLHKNLVNIQVFGNDPQTDKFKYEFLGFVSQEKLAQFYAKAHVVIMFSWYESFPLPPIEAMACGCAVISTKYGTEDYLVDNKNGKLINSFDTDDSVRIITKLIKSPEILYKYTVKGKETAEKYSWDKQVVQLNDFLLKIKKNVSSNISNIQSGDNIEMNKIFDK